MQGGPQLSLGKVPKTPPNPMLPPPTSWGALPMREPHMTGLGNPGRCWWAQGNQVKGGVIRIPDGTGNDILATAATESGERGQRAEGGAGSGPRLGSPAGFSACMLPSCGGPVWTSQELWDTPRPPPGPYPGRGISGPRLQA